MTPLQKISVWFLLLVSIAYIAVDLVISQLAFEWDFGAMIIELAGISGYVFLFLAIYLRHWVIVFPLGFMNIGFAASTTLEILTGSVSLLIFGILGVTGALLMRRKAQLGFRIWWFLIALTTGVALWNWVWVFMKDGRGEADLFEALQLALPSSIWAILYYTAYRIARRSYTTIPQVPLMQDVPPTQLPQQQQSIQQVTPIASVFPTTLSAVRKFSMIVFYLLLAGSALAVIIFGIQVFSDAEVPFSKFKLPMLFQSDISKYLAEKPYENEVLGFKIYPPKGWTIKEDDPDLVAVFVNPMKDQENSISFSANINIVLELLPEEVNLEQYLTDFKKEIQEKRLYNIEIIKKVSLKGKEAYILEGVRQGEDVRVRISQLITIHKGIPYIITGSSIDSFWDKYKDSIQGSFLSLEFTSTAPSHSELLESLGEARSKARDARRIIDIKIIRLALELYYDANSNSYPSSLKAINTPEFMGEGKTLPADPLDGKQYYYAQCSRDKYHLGVDLENKDALIYDVEKETNVPALEKDSDINRLCAGDPIKGDDRASCDGKLKDRYCYDVSL